MPKSKYVAFVWTSILVLFGVSLWGWSVDPDPPRRWFILAFFVPVIWGFVEGAQGGDRSRSRGATLHWHRLVLGCAGLMIAFAVATELALATGLVDTVWAPALRRVRGMGFGVSMMVWGNYLPKLPSPWSVEDQPFDWQRVHRFVGWGATLGGLAVAIAYLLLPLEDAGSITLVILGVACSFALGRKLLSLAAFARRSSGVGHV